MTFGNLSVLLTLIAMFMHNFIKKIFKKFQEIGPVSLFFFSEFEPRQRLDPVLKKGKYSKILENYRGITVRAIFGKLFEYTLLDKLEFAQSELQFDFTEGLSPAMADLLVSEAKAESQDNKRISTLPRFIAKRLSTLFITLFY